MWPWFEAGSHAGGVLETSASDFSAELVDASVQWALVGGISYLRYCCETVFANAFASSLYADLL